MGLAGPDGLKLLKQRASCLMQQWFCGTCMHWKPVSNSHLETLMMLTNGICIWSHSLLVSPFIISHSLILSASNIALYKRDSPCVADQVMHAIWQTRRCCRSRRTTGSSTVNWVCIFDRKPSLPRSDPQYRGAQSVVTKQLRHSAPDADMATGRIG